MPSAHSFAVLQDESSWGTVAASPVNRYIPLSSFGLRAETETRNAKTHCGVLQPRHAEKVRRTVRGPIACPLYGAFASGAADSFAQYLVEWAFSNPEDAERDSKSLHWIDDATASRWSGLRVDSATLAGSESGLTLSLDLVGKTELASVLSTTLPDNRAKLIEFQFSDVALTFDGAAMPIESFEWTISHGLKLKHNGYTPSSCRAAGGNQSLTVKPLKTSATLVALQRLQTMSIKTATLTMRGSHAGTGPGGTETNLSLAFNRLAIMDVADDVAPDSYTWQPIRLACLKPNSATRSVTQTWSTL